MDRNLDEISELEDMIEAYWLVSLAQISVNFSD